MSFVRKLFHKKSESELQKVYTIDEGVTQQVYVYYPQPLAKIKDGDFFTLVVDPNNMKLTSALTGSVFDTSKGGYAVRYNGKVIGACNFSSATIKKLASYGFTIKIKAKRDGWYEKRIIPNIITLGSMPQELILSDEEANRVSEGYLENVKCQLIPAPKKSRAKPHLGFYKNEKLLFDLAACGDDYGGYLKYVDSYVDLLIEERKRKRDLKSFYTVIPVEYTYETVFV